MAARVKCFLKMLSSAHGFSANTSIKGNTIVTKRSTTAMVVTTFLILDEWLSKSGARDPYRREIKL